MSIWCISVKSDKLKRNVMMAHRSFEVVDQSYNNNMKDDHKKSVPGLPFGSFLDTLYTLCVLVRCEANSRVFLMTISYHRVVISGIKFI